MHFLYMLLVFPFAATSENTSLFPIPPFYFLSCFFHEAMYSGIFSVFYLAL